MGRGDLPGPSEIEYSDNQPHPLYQAETYPKELQPRRAVQDHLDRNGGMFDWDELTSHESIAAARLLTLYQPTHRSLPQPSLAPNGAQGVAAHFIPYPFTLQLAASPVQSALSLADAGTIVPVSTPQLYLDRGFSPPAIDPDFRDVGDLAPKIFRLDDVGDFSAADFTSAGGELLVVDPDTMEFQYDDFFLQDLYAGPGEYLGAGFDIMGVLGSGLQMSADGEPQASDKRQAPNKVLELKSATQGEIRCPTSPLPLSGPRFPAGQDPLPPFGTEAWALDYFPAAAIEQIAGMTVPSATIGFLEQPDIVQQCSEKMEDGSQCPERAVAKCVDR